jgi:hypothetical protein
MSELESQWVAILTSSSDILAFKLFAASGLFNVIIATAPSRSNVMVSKSISKFPL